MSTYSAERPNDIESVLAIGRISVETEQGVNQLESIATGWISQLDQVKWPRGLQYFENASFLQGNHLTRFYYSADGGLGMHNFASDKSPYDSLVAKVADNRLIRPVETVVALLTSSQPTPRIEANSDLPEDEDAADLSEIVVDLLWEKPLFMANKIRESAMLACITGTAAIEIEYGETDVPVEIPTFRTVKSPNPFKGEEGEPDEIEEAVEDGTEVVMRKDIMARVWSAFHLYPDPAATSPEDMSWIGRCSFEDVQWVKENFDREGEPGYFPERLEGISQDSATKSILYWYSKFQDIIESPQYYQHGGGLAPQTFSQHGGGAPGQCLFCVIDVKPTRQYPHGRTIIIAGGKLIYVGDARSWSAKYPWRWHPYSFFGWFKIPGKFWSIPLLSELVPLQKKINTIDALVHANRQFMAIGQWLVPKHSKIPEGTLSGVPGQNVKYTDLPGMSKPERVKHVPLPAELLEERNLLIQAIDYIAASGAIEGNLSKSAARSGTILDFLRQEKLRSKAPMLQYFEAFVERIGQNILIEIQEGLKDEDEELTQRIQIAARGHSSLAIKSFIGASLRDHHNVKIDIASALLKSPEAQEAKALEFFQASGGQVTQVERSAIWRAVGMDKFSKSVENASVNRARRIVSRVSAGMLEAAFPMPGVDNARAMLPVFQTEILSDRFHDHDSKIKDVFFNIFEHYSQEAAKEAQREFEMQMALAQAGKKPEGGGQPGQQKQPQKGG